MTPPMDLPPPPPAIHAPLPARTVQSATPLNSMNVRTLHRLQAATSFDPINRSNSLLTHYRYMHVKHWKGKKHKSKASRSNKRKAARKR